MIQRSVHVRRDQFHLLWDNALAPIARVVSGDTVAFDLLDASCGQIGPASMTDAIATLDFGRVDQVNGPIFVEGAQPGDTLEIEFLEIETADWAGRPSSLVSACSHASLRSLP